MDRYAALVAKVDAFVARVEARHASEMQCRAGCSDCCRTRLSVTGVEAARVREALRVLDPETRTRLAARARTDDPHRCVMLEDDGRCAVYAGRPLVCRSHGVPIRLPGARGLPVVDACEKNFTANGAASVAADAVLDQQTLSTMLALVDAEDARATGRTAGERITLAALALE